MTSESFLSSPPGTFSGATPGADPASATIDSVTPAESSTSIGNLPSVDATGDTSLNYPNQPQGHRVLVIESDIETADLLVALLENVGYNVEVAIDGQYGLLLADTFEPELILLSLSLSGMSGYDVTQILRSEPRYAHRFRHIRIFYITEKDQLVQKRFHSLPGTPMHDYIFKPIDIPELVDKVARVFAGK